MVDVKCLSDDELQNKLDKLGFSPGPILPSTRNVYEKKLVQLLVSTPCASPEMNGPREPDRAQDYDDSEVEPSFEIQEQQEEIVKPNSDYNDSKMIIKGGNKGLKSYTFSLY
ncbi:LEM domain-containing protein 1 [Physeter macrocephalus]|uniref:LEM domain-containing protein 1 n=1 Tax=Physeter macrocephalus TaxID=9755 RepID=A0A2Y9F5N3_PHYMC|nr:LEM domain-containing protein 1 [Physeter catodon]|eukprot:XP_007114596.2 LEM domain-containing protein 1 [Physeter catodon]